MGSKKKSDWHLDHAKYSFAANGDNPPKLTIDFTMGSDRRDDPQRDHYMGAINFLKGHKFEFNSQYQPEGNEVIELQGEDNIRRLANLYRRRNPDSSPEIQKVLSAIPQRLRGTGENLPGDKVKPAAPPPLFDDGHITPQELHTQRVAGLKAGRVRVTAHGRGDDTLSAEFSPNPEHPDEAVARVKASLAKRLELRAKGSGGRGH